MTHKGFIAFMRIAFELLKPEPERFIGYPGGDESCNPRYSKRLHVEIPNYIVNGLAITVSVTLQWSYTMCVDYMYDEEFTFRATDKSWKYTYPWYDSYTADCLSTVVTYVEFKVTTHCRDITLEFFRSEQWSVDTRERYANRTYQGVLPRPSLGSVFQDSIRWMESEMVSNRHMVLTPGYDFVMFNKIIKEAVGAARVKLIDELDTYLPVYNLTGDTIAELEPRLYVPVVGQTLCLGELLYRLGYPDTVADYIVCRGDQDASKTPKITYVNVRRWQRMKQLNDISLLVEYGTLKDLASNVVGTAVHRALHEPQ